MEESVVMDEEEQLVRQTSSFLSSNDDLRELCILLDEERNKMHELAEQWRHFGTSTIHKLECQIIDYQDKLNDLEQRQIRILKENDSLKTLINQIMNQNLSNNKQSHKSLPIQTAFGKQKSSKAIYDHLSRTQACTQSKTSAQQRSLDDPLQQQISIQNMYDAIKAAKVYESIENMTGKNDAIEKTLLKEFCNLVWKYLEDRSKPKSSCLL